MPKFKELSPESQRRVLLIEADSQVYKVFAAINEEEAKKGIPENERIKWEGIRCETEKLKRMFSVTIDPGLSDVIVDYFLKKYLALPLADKEYQEEPGK